MRIQLRDRSQLAALIAKKNERADEMANAPPVRIFGDALDLSRLGKGLAGNLKISGTENEGVSESLKDPSMRLMKRSLGEVSRILEEMRAASKTAEDKTLSDKERVDLQVQMTHLQAELYRKTYGMSVSLAKTSPQAGESLGADAMERLDAEEEQIAMMLTEADPAELVKTGGASSQTSDAGRREDGSTKPLTAGERMLRNGANLLSADNAKESTKKIQKQIDTLTRLQREFDDLARENPAAEVRENAIVVNGPGEYATKLGLVSQAEASTGNRTPGFDLRLKSSTGSIAQLFRKVDVFFKDDVYDTLGFGEVWRDLQ